MNRRNFIKGLLSTATVVALAPLAPVVELPIATATFEQIAQITLNKYRREIAANILGASVKCEMLYARGCVAEMRGRALIEPILLNSV